MFPVGQHQNMLNQTDPCDTPNPIRNIYTRQSQTSSLQTASEQVPGTGSFRQITCHQMHQDKEVHLSLWAAFQANTQTRSAYAQRIGTSV